MFEGSYYEGATSGSTAVSKKKKKNQKNRSQVAQKQDVPLEERLKDLLASTSASIAESKSESASAAKAEDLVVSLIKGLHSSDAKLIDDVLNTTNQELVKSCVRRLPVQSLLPLLRELTQRIRMKSDVRNYIRWLQMVLTMHTAYLSSVPEITDELNCHHQLLESRVNMMDRFLRLRGRLGLILEQFAESREPQDHRELSSQAAKAVFVENAEDREMEEEDDAVEEEQETWDLNFEEEDDEGAEQTDDEKKMSLDEDNDEEDDNIQNGSDSGDNNLEESVSEESMDEEGLYDI